MDRLIERCAGLDVHKATVTACVRMPGEAGARHQGIATFSTTTAGLLTLRDWLQSYGVTLVGMESTGIYWRSRVLPIRGRLHLLAAERSAPSQQLVATILRPCPTVSGPRFLDLIECPAGSQS